MEIRRYILPSGVVAAQVFDNTFNHAHPELADYCIFPLVTYSNLKTKASEDPKLALEQWDKFYLVLNKFISTLSASDQTVITEMLVLCHIHIVNFFQKNETDNDIRHVHDLSMLSMELRNIVSKVDIELQLNDKMYAYALSNISVGDFSTAGTGPQDSETFTFTESEAVNINTIILWCKLLSPVFGAFTGRIKTLDSINSNEKEQPCAEILFEIINRRYTFLHSKLYTYMLHAVKNNIDTSSTAVFAKQTASTLTDVVTAALLVRGFVSTDLDYKNGNIMRLIITIAKTSTSNHNTQVSKYVHRERTISQNNDDEDNASQLDVDSSISLQPSSIVPIINTSIPYVLKHYLTNDTNPNPQDMVVNRKLFLNVVDYLTSHAFEPTSINTFVNCGFFGIQMGGGRSIKLLTICPYLQLTALNQLLILSQGYQGLAHIMTAVPGSSNTEINSTNLQIKGTSSSDYLNCLNTYSQGPGGGKLWESKILNIINELSTTHFLYNTAPDIWDAITENSMIKPDLPLAQLNGNAIHSDETIIHELCSFVANYVRNC